MKITNSRYGVILATPGLLIIIALVIFPLTTLLITSLLRYTGIHPITFTGFENYKYVFGDRLFWLGLERTVAYSGGVTGLTFCGGVVLALLLSKITRGSGIFRSLAMFSWAVPMVISGFMWRWIFNPDVGVFSDVLMKLKLTSEPLRFFQLNSVHGSMHNCRCLGSNSLYVHFHTRRYREYPTRVV